MIDLEDFWYIVRSQHYTKSEMEIIYGNLEYVPPKQIDKLWDKAVDKWGIGKLHSIQLRNMMMTDIFARRNSINKNKAL